MNKNISVLALMALLSACGGGGDGSGSSNVSSTVTVDESAPESNVEVSSLSEFEMMVDTSGGEANIPETVTSSASSFNETVVPDGFSYSPVLEQSFVVDISGYSTSPGVVSIYSEFSANDNGTYKAAYNSRMAFSSLESGEAIVDFVSSESHYYVLAEVWFTDGTPPVQKRIPNTETSWVW
ncbi:hypothetical protein K6Q96_23410 [Grimontia kaedaensis]|uniref:Lipoprotein n=1 Tax=Grimontia kaedaensis TaxID=2872157 RepID=A0ABY4X083_9GAMM|nr:hypothetical protein [Grimontia kaedaensis]USH04668.1 hypothetical protein K6Q96_23410 [Grimontia kaedaensis]